MKGLLPRILLFCIDNYHELDKQKIQQLLQYNTEKNYLTVTSLISSLLNSLISSTPLTNDELYYLNEYLDKEITNYTQEAISDLSLSLLQLEIQPHMMIVGNNQSELQFNKSNILSQTSSFLNLQNLIMIPEILIDELSEYRLLSNYIHVFFSFYVLKKEWKEYKIIDQPYNKLQHLRTYMRSLTGYQEQISIVKISYPQVVDDITLDFLEIEMIIDEEPSVALRKLNLIQSKLENRSKNNKDWTQLEFLLDKCYNILGLEKELNHLP